MKEKIDVVILARNSEKSLESCCRAALGNIPVKKLIIVVGKSFDRTLEIAKRFANLLIEDNGKGIGYARNLGLKHVETDFYASIDSDVIICPEWYDGCIETMKDDPLVGACEGYIKPFGRYYFKFQYHLKDQGYCSLANTLLRTQLIKEVGIPNDPFGEDWRLRERIEKRDYTWRVNFDLISTHLVTDIDIFRHYVYFGKHGKTSLVTFLKELAISFKEFTAPGKVGINYRIYVLLLRLSHFYGLISGKRIQEFN